MAEIGLTNEDVLIAHGLFLDRKARQWRQRHASLASVQIPNRPQIGDSRKLCGMMIQELKVMRKE